MIIVMRGDVTPDSDAVVAVKRAAEKYPDVSVAVRTIAGATRSLTEVYLLGSTATVPSEPFESMAEVERVIRVRQKYRAIGRHGGQAEAVGFVYNGVEIGQDTFHAMPGLCAVDSRANVEAMFQLLSEHGVVTTRAGAYKPRTSPYAFQGLGKEGLEILREAADAAGLPCVTEVVEVADVEIVSRYADAFQCGARNMQNFRLLRELGQARKPVFLKRGMAARVEDLLLAAEYILAEGNPDVVLCERGIKTFETATRNTLDLNAVPLIKRKSHLPVVVDPSHGTGLRDLVPPMAKAAAACGADGLLVEVHCAPEEALSDGKQSLYPEQFEALMRELEPFAAAAGKVLRAEGARIR